LLYLDDFLDVDREKTGILMSLSYGVQ